jgi:threonine/homoserine/homoserine lactone efflux protein
MAGLAGISAQRLVAAGGCMILTLIGLQYLIGAMQGRYRLPEPDQAAPARSAGSMIVLGVLTTISNPFWYAWWVTVAAGYLSQAQLAGGLAIPAFYLGHITADYSWDTALAGATQAGSQWLNPRRYRMLILVTGAFMLYLAFLFLKTAIEL